MFFFPVIWTYTFLSHLWSTVGSSLKHEIIVVAMRRVWCVVRCPSEDSNLVHVPPLAVLDSHVWALMWVHRARHGVPGSVLPGLQTCTINLEFNFFFSFEVESCFELWTSNLSASASHVLELPVCATMPSWDKILLFKRKNLHCK
jgi:hypothetical protein